MRSSGFICVLAALSMTAGCVGEPLESAAVSAATGPAVVQTDATTYHFAVPVTVTWSGLNGNATDWIALAPAGSDVTSVARWVYAPAASGSYAFEGPVPGGSYVARAFDNDTYTLMGESDPFAVADASATTAVLSLDQSSYDIDQNITVTWSGMPGGDPLDWIGIFSEGADDHSAAVWLYTGGAASGSVTFTRGVSLTSRIGGNYVARAYLNDTYTRVGETGPVLVGSLVTTDLAAYNAFSPITVSWTHLPGGPEDWVGLAPAGSDRDQVVTWLYTGGAANGIQVFSNGLAIGGTYVARTFVPNTFVISGESAPFTVTAPPAATVTTDQASYALGDPITVTWSGLPGNQHDWIAIAPDGSSDQTVVWWVYTNGQAAGSFTFASPFSAGSYVARAFLNDLYVRLGESAPFAVN